MYLQHFGLTQLPFNLTPDTEFFCNLPSHHEALNVLLIALQSGEGFIKITGPVGAGKTLLCRKLLNELPAPFVTAYIANPELSPASLHETIADDLGITCMPFSTPNRILTQINNYLIEAANQKQKVVLIIDEAQAIPLETLEALRLLTNLETEKQKLLQIVLFGQTELDQVLKKQSIRQLQQRITFSYTLQPLNRKQVKEYLLHRLYIAGNTHTDLFSPLSIRALHFYSQGIPRLLNILTHKAMLVAYGRGLSRIGFQQVLMAAHDTDATHLQWRVRGTRAIFLWLLLISCGIYIYFFPHLPL